MQTLNATAPFARRNRAVAWVGWRALTTRRAAVPSLAAQTAVNGWKMVRMQYVVGDIGTLGWIAVKSLLLYLTAVIGFRIAKRRTLAEMSPFDFVAAVAVGAIVGRVSNANDTSYLAGALTLVTVLAAHAAITRLRHIRSIARLVDHRPCLLAVDGRVLERPLRQSGLTHGDLDALLREHGVQDLRDTRFVIFEQRGRISIVPNPDEKPRDRSVPINVPGVTDHLT
jgi:uncharacterized membrane protein YcaP (DUF421 family)